MTLDRVYPYVVTLSCGHKFKTSQTPFRPDTKYVCKYSTGCGYRLSWAQYEDVKTGYVRTNS